MLRVAYDIRGVYPDDVNGELAYRIGYVFGRGRDTVVVARDLRRGSEELYSSLIEGLCAADVMVYSLGAVPTPVLSFAVRATGADGGVMVTASHNPPRYNGFKLFDSWGAVLPREDVAGILEQALRVDVREGADGSVLDVDVRERYGGNLPGSTERRVVVDFGNGVGIWFKPLLEELFDMVPINDSPDPEFRARGPEPTVDTAEEVAERVADEHADFALLLDGDADRSVFADAHGFLNPSLLFTLFGRWFLQTGRGNVFVASVDISPGVVRYLPGAKVVRSRIGTSFIVQKAREVGAVFSGEYSCHFTAYRFSGHSDPLFFASVLSRYDTVSERKRHGFHDLVSESYAVDDPASVVERAARLGEVLSRVDGVEFRYR
ncbi:TPA: hypothetical protein EYP13_01095, partial [Candidatus Micrarchaeota archaeon]|nr:hypothetical protein [Candidatus Micrarchaeota archaeon]